MSLVKKLAMELLVYVPIRIVKTQKLPKVNIRLQKK